ncbi:M15 family metallopeptidase [Mucilaginibacter auburnensis]|uniref:D-alanyl-D-alanine carboxypeptidase-like protein n=1 Tax=Mucilaginibacter auburnensis TaxID=1457233 RepID=A0A2H9VQT3_9SPHI|nr:M15 family metallopeptidase [Mucilaginibacter auburnensis]PJJ83179.1 D-alanyl-D-alanine carboxypeptidase-like protein [Mucilaginibacter auburnensis]
MKTACLVFISIFPFLLGGQESVPDGAQKLMRYYPSVIAGFSDNHLILSDGTKLLWDDGIKGKTPRQLLETPDVEDMFTQTYSKGALNTSPQKNHDPGRIRNEQLFKKLYGDTRSAVNRELVQITWCPKLVGQKITVTRLHGVAEQLKKVSEELDKHPELKKYLTNIGGTFNWRYINGTKRLSTHSFGTTIDINTAYSDYWQWTCKCTAEDAKVNYKNRIPQAIVDAFEKHGFIWGGKWYHYDTMHFEYRPESL